MFFYDRSQWFERVACPVSSLRTYLPRHTTEGPQSYSCAQFHISEKISLRRNNRGAILFPNVSANKNSTKHTPGTRQRFNFYFFYSLLMPFFCSLFLSLSGSFWGAVPKCPVYHRGEFTCIRIFSHSSTHPWASDAYINPSQATMWHSQT